MSFTSLSMFRLSPVEASSMASSNVSQPVNKPHRPRNVPPPRLKTVDKIIVLKEILSKSLHFTFPIWPSGKLPLECKKIAKNIHCFQVKILGNFFEKNVRFLTIFWQSSGNFPEGQFPIKSRLNWSSSLVCLLKMWKSLYNFNKYKPFSFLDE